MKAAIVTLALLLCRTVAADPLPPTKRVPAGSTVAITDDPSTPEDETEVVVVRVHSALTAMVRLDYANVGRETLAGCQAKLIERTTALQAKQDRAMGTGTKVGLILSGVLLTFLVGVAVGAR